MIKVLMVYAVKASPVVSGGTGCGGPRLASMEVFRYCSGMPSHWKHNRPLSRAQFEARFPDDAACAAYLGSLHESYLTVRQT